MTRGFGHAVTRSLATEYASRGARVNTVAPRSGEIAGSPVSDLR